MCFSIFNGKPIQTRQEPSMIHSARLQSEFYMIVKFWDRRMDYLLAAGTVDGHVDP